MKIFKKLRNFLEISSRKKTFREHYYLLEKNKQKKLLIFNLICFI